MKGGGYVGSGFADYNIMTPQELDELIFNPYKQALGRKEWERIQRQIKYYQYYEGKQHVDPRTGQLVRAEDLERPAGLDYDPTRYATNYFKAFVQRKSRWQMGGKHNPVVTPKQIDPIEETVAEDYKPSTEQARENERAEQYQKLLRLLWKQNKMREKLLQASRDRLIAGNVGCKIVFNSKTGKIHWVFRPATEIIPVYSDDDFEELIAVAFVQEREDEDGRTIYWKQTYSMEDDGFCYLHEALYNESLKEIKTITPKASMGIDFLPYVEFPVQDLSGETFSHNETEDLKVQNDVLNQMNEDAIDSLKFEMFSMTALIGVPEGTANKLQIAPGSVLEVNGGMNGNTVDIKKVEGGFRWKDAYKDTYARIKGAMHEITHLPQIVPQELNFGGLNGDALHVLFHAIIQETEEHWLVWQDRLQELHEKTVRYLQARTNAPNFAYSKDVIESIGDDYDNEIKFVLPLPENRKELVELLSVETASGFESAFGAMQRLGVEDAHVKKMEIMNEKKANMQAMDLYGADKPTQGGSGAGNTGTTDKEENADGAE
jgi:hypothetical protein